MLFLDSMNSMGGGGGCKRGSEDEVCWRMERTHNQCGMPLVKLIFHTFTRNAIFLIFFKKNYFLHIEYILNPNAKSVIGDIFHIFGAIWRIYLFSLDVTVKLSPCDHEITSSCGENIFL